MSASLCRCASETKPPVCPATSSSAEVVQTTGQIGLIAALGSLSESV